MSTVAVNKPTGFRESLASLEPTVFVGDHLDQLIASGLDDLPLPASGQTLARWQALAAVAVQDLSLAKLYEGHTDALAILRELHADLPTAYFSDCNGGGKGKVSPSWGVWAAEAPPFRVTIESTAGGESPLRLQGTKAWCSGAQSGSHALLTAWTPGESKPQLVAVKLDQPGVTVRAEGWKAVGMQGSASLEVSFDGAAAWDVGAPGAYLSRPGFWQGGAGIAACWYGGTLRIARALHESLEKLGKRDAFRLAALGRVDVALAGAARQLRQAACWIDQHPADDARAQALRVRLAAASCATSVLAEVGDALGPAPFCRNVLFAQAAADLPVFIRQSHANHDFAALGEHVANQSADSWLL